MLGDAATLAREGRWIEEIAGFRSALKAAAAGRATERVAIAAKRSPAVNATFR